MKLWSYLFVIPVLLLALGTMSVSARILGIETPKHRYTSIDGLRGFLAMFVFLHHSAVWFYFARLHKWGVVPSALFNHFGSTSVALFFMITSFLFFSKLIDCYGRNFDWLKLYVGRIVRIMPLYIVSIFLIFMVVGFLAHFTLHESFWSLLAEFGQWVMIMEPDINGLNGTNIINSGVQWSLAYEWMFYCLLAPIGAIFFRIRAPLTTLFFAFAFLIGFFFIIHNYYPDRFWWRLCPFSSGLATAFLARDARLRKLFTAWPATIIILVLGFIGMFEYPVIFSFVPMICISFAFCGIACGNDLFGLLSWKPCRELGQISYSIYLLHGLILFSIFYIGFGLNRSARFSAEEFWLTICVCCVVVVIFCSFTYFNIERRGINSTIAITRRIRSFSGSKQSAKISVTN